MKPEDVFTNTWYFRNDLVGGDPNGMAENIKTALTAFYFSTSNDIGPYMSAKVKREGALIKIYDLGQPLPRTPIVKTIAISAAGTSALSLPNEVAIVLSFYATNNRPRRRGRVYLGPWNSSALAAADNTQADARPVSTLRSIIANRALNLMNSTLPLQWVVRSLGGTKVPLDQPGMYEVTAGWIDDAFDTQRRRGAASMSRTPW
jgi:hypothetical protein